jgi:hypothetical protein
MFAPITKVNEGGEPFNIKLLLQGDLNVDLFQIDFFNWE